MDENLLRELQTIQSQAFWWYLCGAALGIIAWCIGLYIVLKYTILLGLRRVADAVDGQQRDLAVSDCNQASGIENCPKCGQPKYKTDDECPGCGWPLGQAAP